MLNFKLNFKLKFFALLLYPVVILQAGHAGAAEPAAAAPEPVNMAPVKPVKPSSPRTIRADRASDERTQDALAVRIAERLAQLRADNAAKSNAAAKVRKVLPVPVAVASAVARPVPQWSYEGATGPSYWASLHPDWAICGSGVRQSPIDIRDGIKLDLDPVAFDYQPSSFTVQDNGHTIEVRLGSGSAITIMNRRYELQQFHFHRPSEERIDGKSFEMAIHLVHKDRAGKQAVVVLLLERGAAQETIQSVWNNLPLEKNDIVAPTIMLNIAQLLPQQPEYYVYMGSMETPPCSEGVMWIVMKQPVQVSSAQMALFSRFYPYNARPVQPSFGRTVKESN